MSEKFMVRALRHPCSFSTPVALAVAHQSAAHRARWTLDLGLGEDSLQGDEGAARPRAIRHELLTKLQPCTALVLLLLNITCTYFMSEISRINESPF
jgi:hypothetical protein